MDPKNDISPELYADIERAAKAAEDIAEHVATVAETHSGEPAIAVAAGILAVGLSVMHQLDDDQVKLASRLMQAMLKARDINAALVPIPHEEAAHADSN